MSRRSLYKWIKVYAVPATKRKLQAFQSEDQRRLKAELKQVTDVRGIQKNRLAEPSFA